ncbi:hypothetical protein M8C21_002803 [Ambrosia artemisiifolia]|uniref:Uncharacterized protein n=1 Tax=Ambrosia artemisiifolia TaxID=4212 RepID=A0AAD5BT16_AMBAR|nr:hypothetical protein M8C21_002803 [Ambrosia artemisiifolia]
MASNRSPSPLSSRNCRNSEANSTTRKSFSGNPFPRPNVIITPKSSNPYTPSNTPTATDLTKRNSIARKSINNGSMFQDGKENRKDALRSPARSVSKNFMSPTISAASKFTPSPRKKILGEKNDVTRASFEFFGKESDLNSEPLVLEQMVRKNDELNESKIVEQTVEKMVEQQEIVVQNVSVDEVNPGLTNDDTEIVKNRSYYCCSPITSSPVIAADHDQQLPPYDPKKNFLSPRPQFLRYKPNPRIEFLLNKEEKDDEYEESDVTRLEDTFNLESDSSSETEEKEQESDKEAESGDDSVDSVNGSVGDLSETVLDEKPIDSKVEKVSKPRFFTLTCFSLSFTENPPVNLPIYEDVGFSEMYHESLRYAAFAKERFDDLVENVKVWSMDLVSYLYEQRSLLIPTQKIESLQFFNLTTSEIQEEFRFNRHIGTDYIQEFEEETERLDEEEEEEEEEVVSEEIDEESDLVEVVSEEPIFEQIHDDLDEVKEKSVNLDEGFVGKSEVVTEEQPINEQIQTNIDEAESEMVQSDVEIVSNVADSSSFSTQVIATVCVAAFSIVAMAVSSVFYMKKERLNESKTAKIRVNDDKMPEESGSSESISVQKGNKKKSSNKRESLASSTSEFSMSESLGSITTFERIAMKHKDEVMLTPIRRSSRLLKNQAICS